jgi:hypothetical protein
MQRSLVDQHPDDSEIHSGKVKKDVWIAVKKVTIKRLLPPSSTVGMNLDKNLWNLCDLRHSS